MIRTHWMNALMLFTVIIFAPLAFATVPSTINYQGYLKDSAGAPVNGAISVRFSLYSSNPARSNPVWQETKDISASNGIYSTQLGSATPISTPFDVPYWLEVKVEGDAEMALQELSSVPYARRAQTSDSVADGSVSDAKITGPISDSKLTSNIARLNAPQTFNGNQTFGSPVTFLDTVTFGSTFTSAVKFGSKGPVTFETTPTFTSTTPFMVLESTRVINLNADLLDGQDSGFFLSASNIYTGTLPSDRLSGSYTGITGVGTLSSLAVSGNASIGGTLSCTTPKTKYYNVTAAAFTSATSATTYSGNWMLRYITAPAGTQNLIASLNLPHGAVLSSASCRINDSSAAYDIVIGLLNIVTSTWICGPASSSGSTGIQSLTTSPCGFATIDNINSSYAMRMFNDTACGSACSIYACTVTYTVTELP
ncbi:MAG: hypothetical protein IPQ16_14035 [Geobacteraceae bacterium]|nr:hypothetical protein [Geobacteraceae bacterium]